MRSQKRVIRTIGLASGLVVGGLYLVPAFQSPKVLVFAELAAIALAWGLIAWGSVWVVYWLLAQVHKVSNRT
jgi:hypothetical protein